MWSFAFLVLGLGGLWFGTSLVLNGTIAIGERRGLSEVFLGLTVLAIGTDLPELIVAIDGALLQIRGTDASGIVAGNAIGSAISQGGLVLGVCGLVSAIDLAKHRIRWDGLVLLFSIALLALFGLDGRVTRVEGASLVAAYGIYLASLIRGVRRRSGERDPEATGDAQDVLKILGGFLVLLLSAEVVVQQALDLASLWGVSTTLIGVFLVGVGTSLPELSLSLRAALRGRSALSVGNVVGSNIFDVLLPIGVSALLVPLPIARELLLYDLPALFAVSLLLLFWALRRSARPRLHAATLLAFYLVYLVARVGFESVGGG